MYKYKLYRQIDGVKMSSCFGSTLAKLFLACFEKLFANTNNFSLICIYDTYAKNIWAVFDSDSTFKQFFECLSSQHKEIKFTFEKNTNCNNLPFLGVQTKLKDAGYDTCAWRKSTNTGLLRNFNTLCLNAWKSVLIMCLLDRAKKLCRN